MSRFLTPALESLQPYTPGEQPQDKQYIKLNTNENPYPPSPWVAEVLNAKEVERLRLYPAPACRQLLRAAATRYGLEPDQIMPGNGSDENLFFALRAFCGPRQPLACADVTYGCYKVWADLLQIPLHIIPLEEDFSLDPVKYCALGETIVIANPNAPTGLALKAAEIEMILQENPDNVVIVDEAYVDFGAESCVPLIHKYDNLLVVQTFSKSRSLAGARLGLAMGSRELIADLNRVKFSINPYNINKMTLLAGAASLRDEEYFRRSCAAVIGTREWTERALLKLGFTLTESWTNFLFARTDRMPGARLYEKLREKGVLVRHFNAPRTADWVRVTVGTPQQMSRFVEVIEEIFAEEGV